MSDVVPKLGTLASEIDLDDGLDKIDCWHEEVKATHQLHDGSSKFYHKGFKMRAVLKFIGMGHTQWESLRLEANKHTELNFIPDSANHANVAYTVRWVNANNLIYSHVVFPDTWNGTIILEGTEILSSIPGWI